MSGSDQEPVDELAEILDAIASLSVAAQGLATRLDEDDESVDALNGYLEEMEYSTRSVRRQLVQTAALRQYVDAESVQGDDT